MKIWKFVLLKMEVEVVKLEVSLFLRKDIYIFLEFLDVKKHIARPPPLQMILANLARDKLYNFEKLTDPLFYVFT